MAMVSLESGALKYTTESGAVLLDGELSDPSIPPQLGLIIDGMLASTAIPGFFRMRKIGTDNYVDGGIRVNVPIKAALDLGATEIFAALPDPPLSHDDSYDKKSFLDIWQRAPDIKPDQLRSDQPFPRNGLGTRYSDSRYPPRRHTRWHTHRHSYFENLWGRPKSSTVGDA